MGICDKYSHRELTLRAVPNARDPNVPATLYLLEVLKRGGEFFFRAPASELIIPNPYNISGIPPSTLSDMGGELGKFIALQTTLR